MTQAKTVGSQGGNACYSLLTGSGSFMLITPRSSLLGFCWSPCVLLGQWGGSGPVPARAGCWGGCWGAALGCGGRWLGQSCTPPEPSATKQRVLRMRLCRQLIQVGRKSLVVVSCCSMEGKGYLQERARKWSLFLSVAVLLQCWISWGYKRSQGTEQIESSD